MASLNEIKAAELTANASVESRTNDTKGVLDGLETNGGASLQRAQIGGGLFGLGANNLDFIGINAAGLDDMCAAIDSYCVAVTNKLGEFDAQANTEGHFAGQYAESMREFMMSIKSSCIAQVEALKNFKLDLQAVVTTMQAKDTAVAGGINAEANSISSASGINNSN